MSKTQRIILLITVMFALFVVPNMDAQANADQVAAKTTQMQASQSAIDWCCVTGLACCIQETK